MTDIVERLNKWKPLHGETVTGDVQLYMDAADEIERLQMERDCFVEQIAARQPSVLERDMQEIMRINNELRSEIKRLRERLSDHLDHMGRRLEFKDKEIEMLRANLSLVEKERDSALHWLNHGPKI